MQNILLDILIIGLLVILFGSIYRRHATVRIRFWLLGWFFILIHFGLLLFTPPDARGAKLLLAASLSALLLCGAAFALSSRLVWERGWRFALPALLLSIPPVLYVTVETMPASPMALLAGVAAAAQAAYLVVILRFGRGGQGGAKNLQAPLARRWGAAIIAGGTVWLALLLRHGLPDYTIYPLLSEIFLLNALLYWEDFRRSTAGVLVSTFGLAAWGAVFPCALLGKCGMFRSTSWRSA
jgi:hypothetical protein